MIKDVIKQYQSLTQEWNRKPADLEKCGEKLKNLKISLTSLSYLPNKDGISSKQELLIARDILEIGARWAIETKDIPSFERYLSQLKCYYFDYKSDLPESPYRSELLGLNLLCLLAQGRLADFHAELERLPVEDVQSDVYIKHPVSMEQYMMEGSYNKVFLSKGNVPSERYNFFINILLDTTRDEIANCIESAYNRLAVDEATRMLFFEKTANMTTYAEKRGWRTSDDGFYVFSHPSKLAEEDLPSLPVCEQMLDYARELEKIV